MTTETQSSFFGDLGPRSIKVDVEKKEPVFWFCELRLMEKWAPGTPIRKIELRRGLNILWAEPEDPVANHDMYGDGLAGHATGKTLFCRILRFLIGETNYGTKDLRDGVAGEFLELWAVAHIRLAEKSWVVGRSMVGPRGDFAVLGDDIDALLDKEPPATGYELFMQQLHGETCESLQSLTGDESWRHLLPWLTRDQEARFSSVVAWRDSESEGDNPRSKVADQHLLMRALLGIFDVKENNIRKTLDELSKKVEDDTSQKPEAQRQLDRERGRILAPISELNLSLANFDTLQALIEHLDSAVDVREARIQQLREQTEPTDVRDARLALETARVELASARTEARTLSSEIEQLVKTQSEQLLTIKKIKLGGISDAGRISDGFCPNGIKTAQERQCVHLKTTPQFEIAELEQQAREAETRVQAKKMRKGQLESAEERLEANVTTKEKEFFKIQGASQVSTINISREIGRYRNLVQRVKDVVDAQKGLKNIEDNLEKLGPKLEKLRKELIALRDDQKDKIAQLSEIFGDVVRAVMGSSVRANLKVTDAGLIQTYAERNGVLRGAALDTIKTLAFDLAGIVASIEGRGSHPRFLIHDGPREADMARVIYERFFLYAERLENAFSNPDESSFQYILTTTTNPPLKMQRGSKWLVGDVLNSKTADGRLLKKNL